MDKRFWAIIGVIAAIFIGIVWFSGNKDDNKTDTTTTAKAPVHITAKVDSKVKFVEYGDFECFYCGQAYPIVEQVVEKYKDQISFEFRHYPITTAHRNAFAAARASEAAANQGKFWEMYRLMYSNQSTWEGSTKANATFEGFAAQLGLDMDKYKKDYSSSEVNDAINASVAGFNKLGIRKSTPTFLLNGTKIEPTISVDGFSKLIDAELAKQK